jgi:hypothetical protein
MKKTENKEFDDLDEHYEFDYSKAQPNRFAKQLNEQKVIIILSPELRKYFPNSESVNNALQKYLQPTNQYA